MVTLGKRQSIDGLKTDADEKVIVKTANGKMWEIACS